MQKFVTVINTLKQNRWAIIFVIYLRYLIGGAYVFSAMPKVLGERFMTLNGESAPIDTFPHFFETLYRSGIYWEFLGWSQVVAAFFLMTQVFATAGALAFLAISLNVFMITISYEFAGTPVITGLMLLGNIFLLLWDYQKLSILVKPGSERNFVLRIQHNPFYNDKFWIYLGLCLFLTTAVYVYYFGRNPMAWFGICLMEGFSGWIYMTLKYKKVAYVLTKA